jgi:Co/Zn/Cd efflux system component
LKYWNKHVFQYVFNLKPMQESEQSHNKISGKNLGLAIFLNVGITLAEAIGGIISGSMALLSDAAHNFSDVISLVCQQTGKKGRN